MPDGLSDAEFSAMLDRVRADKAAPTGPSAAPTQTEDFPLQPNADVPLPASLVLPRSVRAAIEAPATPFLQGGTTAEEMAGARDGVNFAPGRGASKAVRAALSFDSDRINQFKLLSKVYGMENVDVKGGQFNIRNQTNPDTGKIEDFPVNPVGFDTGDIAGMAGDVLPVLAGAVGAKIGGARTERPILKVLSGLTGMALGQESAAGAQEAVSRWAQGNDIKPGSLAYERSIDAAKDMALGAFLAGGTKIASKAASAAAGAFGIETGSTATTEAAKQLADKTGVQYPLTPGQAAENKFLMRMEATAKPSIGSVGVMSRIDAEKSAAEDELRRVFLGLPRTLTDEQLAATLPKADITGQKVLGRLGTESLRLEGDVAKASAAVERTGTAEAQARAGVNLASPLEPTSVGTQLRAKAVGDFDAFKGAMGQRYEAFEANPEITNRVVPGDNLAKLGRQVENELFPQAQRTKTVPTGIVGPTGSPITKTVTSIEPIDAFVASAAKRTVDGLKALEGARVGIADMKRIRTNLDNSIAEGIAIPGTDVKQLLTLREKLTDSIRDSLGKMNPKLLSQWDSLNTDYAKGMERFNRVGIRQMLVKEGETGSVGNAQLARSVGSGEPSALDRYNDFKQFYGSASPEFRSVQQLAREQVLQGSLSETSGYITGAQLRSNLRSLDPEVAKDLFGANKQELHRIGEVLSVAQGNLDVNELKKLASRGNLTAAMLPDLIAAESAKAKALGNSLIKAAAKGSYIGEEVLKPSQVVRNLTQMDPDQAVKVLGVLHDRPDLLHDVRSLAVEDLWSSVQANLKGRTGVTSGLIEESLGNEVQRRTWKVLLGNDVVDNLTKLGEVVKSGELGTRVFGSAGAMRATAETSELEKGGILSVASRAAQRMLIATLYTGSLNQSVINLATPQNQGRLLNAVIASTPFVEQVRERFGPDAPAVMQSLRSIAEPKQERGMRLEGRVQSGAPIDLRTLSPEEFDAWMSHAKQ